MVELYFHLALFRREFRFSAWKSLTEYDQRNRTNVSCYLPVPFVHSAIFLISFCDVCYESLSMNLGIWSTLSTTKFNYSTELLFKHLSIICFSGTEFSVFYVSLFCKIVEIFVKNYIKKTGVIEFGESNTVKGNWYCKGKRPCYRMCKSV